MHTPICPFPDSDFSLSIIDSSLVEFNCVKENKSISELSPNSSLNLSGLLGFIIMESSSSSSAKNGDDLLLIRYSLSL